MAISQTTSELSPPLGCLKNEKNAKKLEWKSLLLHFFVSLTTDIFFSNLFQLENIVRELRIKLYITEISL